MNIPIISDTTWLAPHPRTVEWWTQRVLCERCTHMRKGDTWIKCEVTPWAGVGRAYCIDAREPGQRCGTHATLFQPKEIK